MCRNIKTLYHLDPPASQEEVHDAAVQFVRKVSGYRKPSRANEEAFDAAVELGRFGVTANSILPGPVQTGWITPELEETLLPTIPTGRLGAPQDIANAVLFLASVQADWISGQTIYVGGGMGCDMGSIHLLDEYREERNQLLKSISVALESDPIIKAAWLFGSLGRGDEDTLSDIDLWVIVDDDHIGNLTAHPHQYTSQVGDPVLFLEAPQNAPEGGAYLMTCYDAPVAPHIVDWYWQPQSRAFIPSQVRVLFDHVHLSYEDRPVRFVDSPTTEETTNRPMHFISFFWMMLMITAKKAFRAPWDEEMVLLPLLTDSIGEAQKFLGADSPRLSRDLPPHRLPAEKIQLLYNLADQMSEMMTLIAERGEEVPALIKPGAYRYLQLIASVIEVREK